MFWVVRSQDLELPSDFRQHTITDYNSSLINPVFSLDRNNPESVALWTRWQWQSIDSDPTSLFLNYTRRLNAESAAGVAFFQHNTGLFIQTGGVLNYAYVLSLQNDSQISFGANLFAYQSKLADDRSIQDPDIPLPIPSETNDFIMQFAPGVQLESAQFRIGLAVENLLDYNFTESEKVTKGDEKFLWIHTSYEFPVSVFSFTDDTYLRPTLYYKTIPKLDNQIGFNALLSTPKFWAQTGYNSFYGVSVGAGGRFVQKFSLGALMEFATKSEQDGFDPTVEVVAAFYIGPQEFEKQEILPIEEEPEKEEELITEEEKQEEALALEAEKERQEAMALQEEMKQREEEARKEREQFVRDSLYNAKLAEVKAARLQEAKRKEEEAKLARDKFVKDSINAAKLAEAEAKKKEEELRRLAETEEVKPEEGEKYQEALSEDGLRPGFYLIANVFGTKRYFEAFMKNLSDQGLNPKSFFRSVNKYNYVYLERYDTMTEARRARDSKFNGRYKGDTWIFRVVPK